MGVILKGLTMVKYKLYRVSKAYKALTNQGEVHQYIDYIVCFNTRDSHYHLKEHTILYVFHAPRSNSLIS